jgi:hypothetical protein
MISWWWKTIMMRGRVGLRVFRTLCRLRAVCGNSELGYIKIIPCLYRQALDTCVMTSASSFKFHRIHTLTVMALAVILT